MQARAGAMDELLASGALTDLTNPVDDIQAQLDQVSTSAPSTPTWPPSRPSSARRRTGPARRGRAGRTGAGRPAEAPA